MTRNNVSQLLCDEHDFRTLVKNAFGTRRKTLRNCLRSLVQEWQPDNFAAILQDPLFDQRAEQLSVQDFIGLTVRLKTK
jgi:16S rRNA (adenine1518-N6/adenine1519-N6)-dimethyltransferase